jgi:NAD(P)-dependent dehydrogenase (short-subunit alcohol dehydrogenase family)
MGNHLEFAGKVALITGGNSGIGAAAARRVAELGAQVVVTGRRQSEGRLLVNDIKRDGGSAVFIQADLSQPEQVKRIVPFTVKTFGRLDYALTMPESQVKTGRSQIRPRKRLTASSL